MKKLTGVLWALMIVSIVATALIYSRLPEEVPLHWNWEGEVDRVGAKSNVWMTAFLPVAIYLLMLVVPRIDPRREAYQKHRRAYKVVMAATVLFLIGLHWLTIAVASGLPVDVSTIVRIAVGLLLIIIGWYMPQVQHNYMFGIRTPWTLASSTVWEKTHKHGGYAFVVAGVIFAVTALIPSKIGAIVSFGVLMLVTIGIMVYSYLLYRQEQNR